VVFTIPKRLRPYCLCRRALLGDLARLAARIVTDGGFRSDGTFVRWPGWPAFDSATLSEAFRRAVLRLFAAAADRPFAFRPGRCVAKTAALAGRTARTAPGFAPASPQRRIWPLTAAG